MPDKCECVLVMRYKKINFWCGVSACTFGSVQNSQQMVRYITPPL